MAVLGSKVQKTSPLEQKVLLDDTWAFKTSLDLGFVLFGGTQTTSVES